MKEIMVFTVISALMVLTSCRKDDINLDTHLVLLKVDYSTYAFEGGMMFDLANNPDSDTVQIGIEYEEPADLGYIKLFHNPDSILVFDGSILWSGTGHQNFPDTLNEVSSFQTFSGPATTYDSTRTIEIFTMPSNQNPQYQELIWNEISTLQIVQHAYNQNFNFSFFCYTPSIGIGSPSEWDYFVLFYIQS